MEKIFIWILESSIFLYIADNTSESNAEIQIIFFFKEWLTDLNFMWKTYQLEMVSVYVVKPFNIPLYGSSTEFWKHYLSIVSIFFF